MAISAVALFGSRARGDQNPESDTDLLLVSVEDAPPQHSGMGSVSLSTYSFADLSRKAEDGDLFLWHCLYEGQAMHDPEEVFEHLRARFRLRGSYAREIGYGASVGWLLVMFGQGLPNARLAARRATWAVRTILIAKSAEHGAPKFAAGELEALAPIKQTPRLIRLKGSASFNAQAAGDLEQFLLWAGLTNPLPTATSPADFLPLLASSGNSVGVHLLDHAMEAPSDYA